MNDAAVVLPNLLSMYEPTNILPVEFVMRLSNFIVDSETVAESKSERSMAPPLKKSAPISEDSTPQERKNRSNKKLDILVMPECKQLQNNRTDEHLQKRIDETLKCRDKLGHS